MCIRDRPSLRGKNTKKSIGTNVFFTNLPDEDNRLFHSRKFFEIFRQFGKILSCRLDPNKNIGFISFEHEEVAKTVVKKYNNSMFFGNRITCGILSEDNSKKPIMEEKQEQAKQFSQLNKKYDLNEKNMPRALLNTNNLFIENTVFVSNLPTSITVEEIRNHFNKIGNIMNLFISDKISSNALWAFVKYSTAACAIRAIKELNNTFIRKKQIVVSQAFRRGETQFHLSRKPTKRILYLKELSRICDKDFVSQFCHQRRIKFDEISLTKVNLEKSTHTARIKCRTDEDARKLYNSINNRLIAGSIIKASWENSNEIENVEKDISNNVENQIRTGKCTSYTKSFHDPVLSLYWNHNNACLLYTSRCV